MKRAPLNREIKKYIIDVKSYLICDWRTRQKFLKDLKMTSMILLMKMKRSLLMMFVTDSASLKKFHVPFWRVQI